MISIVSYIHYFVSYRTGTNFFEIAKKVSNYATKQRHNNDFLLILQFELFLNMSCKKYAIYTLGCKLNFSESAEIMNYFESAGYKKTTFNSKSDMYIINTCSVTSNANKKSRNAIARAKKLNNNAIIMVTGCYAQLSPQEIEKLTGIDYIIGINDKTQIKDILNKAEKKTDTEVFLTPHKRMHTFFPAYHAGNRTRAFLKIQDGCDYFCSYCTIPFARGRSRNQSIKETINQINEIASKNIKEVVITGVNIGDFGKSTGENFNELLLEISKIKDIERFRLGSIEPDLLNDEIIKLVADSSVIMPHFHIPLQSGSDKMLKIMRRKYDTTLFRKKIELIKKHLPHAFIGIDLIVGVNGETESYFEESAKFVESLDISEAHVFSYSERQNTKALDITPKISGTEKKKRADIIKKISKEKHLAFLKRHIGYKTKVLFEKSVNKDTIKGFSDNYINVVIDYQKHLINKIVKIKIEDIVDYQTAKGKII